MIIVEGCDNTGKSTLVRQLKGRVPELHIIKSPGPGPDLGKWVFREMMRFRQVKPRRNVRIYDRFFFSEFVYGPVLRNKVCYTGNEQEFVLNLMGYTKPLVIICYRNLQDCLDTLDEREQMEGVEDHYAHLSVRYQSVVEPMLREYEIPYVTYSFAKEGTFEKEILPKVIDEMVGMRR